MGIAERREREKQQRRNDILDAAERVFFSKGFNIATMDDLAEEAELSKGTLYLYFKNKEDVYLGLTQRALKQLLKMFKEAVKKPKSGIEKLKAIGYAYQQYAQSYSDYFRTIADYEVRKLKFANKKSLESQCHQLGRQVLQVVADAVQAGINDGTIRSDLNPMRTAFLLQGQSTGVIQLIATEGEHIKEFENFDPAQLSSDFMNIIEHALKPKS